MRVNSNGNVTGGHYVDELPPARLPSVKNFGQGASSGSKPQHQVSPFVDMERDAQQLAARSEGDVSVVAKGGGDKLPGSGVAGGEQTLGMPVGLSTADTSVPPSRYMRSRPPRLLAPRPRRVPARSRLLDERLTPRLEQARMRTPLPSELAEAGGSMDAQDEQRQVFSNTPLQQAFAYPQPQQMWQPGQTMGVFDRPTYYPTEFAEGGTIMMPPPNYGFGTMWMGGNTEMGTEMEEMEVGDEHNPVYGPTEGFLRYRAAQQAESALQAAPPAFSAQGLLHGDAFMGAYGSLVMQGQFGFGQQEWPLPSSMTPQPYGAAQSTPYGYQGTLGGYGLLSPNVFHQDPIQETAREGTVGAYTQNLQQYFQEQRGMGTGTPQALINSRPETPSQFLQQDFYGGPRHSYPGAWLSYGSPLAAPSVDAAMLPPRGTPILRSNATPPIHADTEAPSQFHHHVLPNTANPASLVIQPPTTASLPQHAPPPAPSPPAANNLPAPDIAMYTFVSTFTTHFRGRKSVLNAFEGLVKRFNRHTIDPKHFYAGVYKILHLTKSMHLLEPFWGFLPREWRERDMGWLHEAIEKEVGDKLAMHRAQRGGGAALQVERGDEQVGAGAIGQQSVMAGQASPAILDGTEEGKKRKAVEALADMPKKKTMIVKLPVNWVEKRASRALARKKVLERVQSDTDGEADAVLIPSKAKKWTPKKKVPKNGFRTGQSETPPSNIGQQTRVAASALTSQTTTTRPKRSLPRRLLLNRNLDSDSDSDDADDTAATTRTPPAIKPGQKRALPASQVPHVGPIFATRREVLARRDKPYIHAICGQGFHHPQDVKLHHFGNGVKTKSCPARKGAGNGEREWDEHESCQVSYPKIAYTKVMEGFVILDRVSWDLVEGATGAGRMLLGGGGGGSGEGGEGVKAAESAEVVEDANVTVVETTTMTTPAAPAAKPMTVKARGDKPADVAEEAAGIKRMVAKAGGNEPDAGIANGTKRVTPAKRKVAEAGGGETSVGGVAATTVRAPPKRKVVRAGGDETDIGADVLTARAAAALGFKGRK